MAALRVFSTLGRSSVALRAAPRAISVRAFGVEGSKTSTSHVYSMQERGHAMEVR